MEVSRVLLNKAVVREFGISAAHLLEQRLLQEIKNDLLFTAFSVKGFLGTDSYNTLFQAADGIDHYAAPIGNEKWGRFSKW